MTIQPDSLQEQDLEDQTAGREAERAPVELEAGLMRDMAADRFLQERDADGDEAETDDVRKEMGSDDGPRAGGRHLESLKSDEEAEREDESPEDRLAQS